MELVVGAMGSLIPKLKDLLKEEYNLQKRVKDQVRSLELELESAHAALRKVAKVPPDQLEELVKIWAREVREASYDMEDILDTFLVRVHGSHKSRDKENLLQGLAEKMTGLFKKSKERHKIAAAIEKIRKNLQEVTDRRGRFTVDSIVAKPAASSQTVVPRLAAMFREASQIIGIDKSSADLISMLLPKGGDESNQKIKVVSVVGVGGLGKTTLAKAVYDKRDKSLFDYGAFVPVGQDPDLKKVFRDILIHLDKEKYTDMKYTVLDENQLIDELRVFLKTKRYFVVIDDVWEPQSLEIIKLALVGNNCGSRVIITTRKFEVAKEADEVYKLGPLSYDNSRKLFYTRLFGGEDKCPNNHPDELSDTILKKCRGVPLAIITMASFLLGKSRKEWIEVCNSPSFYQDKNDRHMENTMHILSLSYYDLPCHLKTCLLYLRIFPEDSLIDKGSLIWKWIAEGFVEEKPGRGLFEVGEEYFHDLINRSMIQGVDSQVYGIMDGCRVHDMVLDLMVSIAREEKFVSVDGTLAQSHTRWLAPKNRKLDLTQDTHVNLPQLRSFILQRCVIVKWALHQRLRLIRVLALEHCRIREGCHSLGHIGKLRHLRYLGIRDTWFGTYPWGWAGPDPCAIPEGIGSLEFLQILDLEDTGIRKLPCSIGKLRQLACLRARKIRAPDGVIGSLTSLEELQIKGPCFSDESKKQFVKDLGDLCQLRVLKINESWNMDVRMERDFMLSLGKLKKMRHLTLGDPSITSFNINMHARDWDAAVAFQDLRCLFFPCTLFDKLPSWISSSHLPSLSHLEIRVGDVDEQGLKALGGLPELCYLNLRTSTTATITRNTEADGCFQKLRSFVSCYSSVQFVANEDSSASFTICAMHKIMVMGTSRKKDDCRVVVPAIVVMPNLEELEFGLSVKQLMQNNVVSCGDLGLEHLPSIRRVKVYFWCDGAFEDEVEREEAALRHAIDVHPNRPALQIEYWDKQDMKRTRKRTGW